MNTSASLVSTPDPIAVLMDAAEGLADAPAALASVVTLLCVADRVTARAVGMLTDGIDHAQAGMPVEMLLRLAARKVGHEGVELTGAADTLRAMPQLTQALASGVVSWPQARGIIREARGLPAEARAQVDALVGEQAGRLLDAEPEALLDRVTDEVQRLTAARLTRREERRIDRSFLALQPRLDGSGGSFYGETDAESFATLATALDAAANRPLNAETHPDAPTRAQQRMDALVGICETYLNGHSGGSARPRPRMLVTVDLANLADPKIGEQARILWGTRGRPARISRLSAQRLLCDAEITPIIFKDGTPIGIGDTRKTIPDKTRRALEARDGGCRFPGCRMPVAWTDAHHIIPRGTRDADGRLGDNRLTNLGLFCRRCHDRIHRKKWKIRLLPDGAIGFTRRGKTYLTYPRGSPPHPS